MVQVSQVQAWDTTAGAPIPEAVRASVVESVVAGLLAAQLSEAEYLAVVGAYDALRVSRAGVLRGFALTVTAVGPVGVQTQGVVRAMPAPHVASAALTVLAREASPELLAAVMDAWEVEASVRGAPDVA